MHYQRALRFLVVSSTYGAYLGVFLFLAFFSILEPRQVASNLYHFASPTISNVMFASVAFILLLFLLPFVGLVLSAPISLIFSLPAEASIAVYGRLSVRSLTLSALVPMLVFWLLESARQYGASDVLIESVSPPIIERILLGGMMMFLPLLCGAFSRELAIRRGYMPR